MKVYVVVGSYNNTEFYDNNEFIVRVVDSTDKIQEVEVELYTDFFCDDVTVFEREVE